MTREAPKTLTFRERKTLTVLGILKILLSILAIIAGATETSLSSLTHENYGSINAFVCVGSIYGAFQLIFGSLTIWAAKDNSKYMAKVSGIFNILGVIVSLALLVTSSFSLNRASAHDCQLARSSFKKVECDKLDAIVCLDCLLVTIALSELALTITLQSAPCCKSTGQVLVRHTDLAASNRSKLHENLLFGLSIIEFCFGIIIISLGAVVVGAKKGPYSINAQLGTGILFGLIMPVLSFTNFGACTPKKKFCVLFFLIPNAMELFIGVFMVVSSIVSLSLPVRNGRQFEPTDDYTTTAFSTTYNWRKQYEIITRDNSQNSQSISDRVLAMDLSLAIFGFLSVIVLALCVRSFTELYFLEHVNPDLPVAAVSAPAEESTVVYVPREPSGEASSGARAREPAITFPKSMNLNAEAPPYQPPGPDYQPPAVEDTLPSYDSLQLN